jgi:glycerophosphoryl diester phosphodiesterase
MRGFVIAVVCVGAVACGTVGSRSSRSTINAIAPASLPAFFDCLRTRRQAVVAAHRGGPAPGYAENAVQTFAHTLSQAPSIMEIDIARTKDGALVLMHDDTVDRTTNGTGDVRDLTLAQFQALRLRDREGQVLDAHPPTLREALEWAAGKTILELDVKRGVPYEDVVAAVRAAGAHNRVVFITSSNDAAMRVARLAPELMIVSDMSAISDLDDLVRRGADVAHLLAWTGIEEPNAALNAGLAARGVEVSFGTLGGRDSWDARFAREHRERYAAFAGIGLQIVSTDRPAEAARDLDVNDGADGHGVLQCVDAR